MGALVGAWLNHQLRGELILVLFSLLMLGAAVGMLRRGATDAGEEAFAERYSAAGWTRLVAVGLGVGLLTGFFGVGGGFLIVPALALVIGLPMTLAVGTSLVAIALNSLWGLLGHLRFGGLDWGLTLLFIVGGLVGVAVGGRLAGRLPERGLRTAFALLIIGVALFTFAHSAAALACG